MSSGWHQRAGNWRGCNGHHRVPFQNPDWQMVHLVITNFPLYVNIPDWTTLRRVWMFGYALRVIKRAPVNFHYGLFQRCLSLACSWWTWIYKQNKRMSNDTRVYWDPELRMQLSNNANWRRTGLRVKILFPTYPWLPVFLLSNIVHQTSPDAEWVTPARR